MPVTIKNKPNSIFMQRVQSTTPTVRSEISELPLNLHSFTRFKHKLETNFKEILLLNPYALSISSIQGGFVELTSLQGLFFTFFKNFLLSRVFFLSAFLIPCCCILQGCLCFSSLMIMSHCLIRLVN